MIDPIKPEQSTALVFLNLLLLRLASIKRVLQVTTLKHPYILLILKSFFHLFFRGSCITALAVVIVCV